MKRILLTTALVAFASAPVVAQTSGDAPVATTQGHEMSTQGEYGLYLTPAGDTTIYGSEFIGKNVYVTAEASHPRTIDGVPDGWENVATVDDILMTRDGDVRGILVDVGGFLGIGTRTVALDMSALDIVYDNEGDDFYVVFTSTREELEAAPEYDQAADIEARTGTWDMAAETVAEQPSTTGVPAQETMAQDAVPQDQDRMAEADDRFGAAPEGYVAAAAGEMSVDDLKSAEVFDATNERISGVADVLVTDDGDVTYLIVDVGGFLGIGAKSIAVDFADVQVLRGEDASDLRVNLPMTREQLEEMPEYEG